MRDYLKPRTNMVDSQLRPNRVTDGALLDAFLTVPRELFVPERLRGAAYSDESLPLGKGRYLMEPLELARLVQEAKVDAEDAVLVVGCGSGYGAAILGRLARIVTAVESEAGFVAEARAALRAAGADNVGVVEGDLTRGHAQRGPYDVILIEGTVAQVPPALLDQLADGGRLIGVVSNRSGEGAVLAADATPLAEAVVMTKLPTGVATRVLFETGAHDLPGFAAEPSFTF